MSDSVINTKGAAIHVAENGAGEPALMFLHYWGGSSRTWRGVIDRLGGKPRCIALDQRGWGDSVAIDGRYDLRTMADDAEGVAGALGLSRYVLVGHSMGGKVAQIIAARRPHKHRAPPPANATRSQSITHPFSQKASARKPNIAKAVSITSINIPTGRCARHQLSSSADSGACSEAAVRDC